MQRLLPDMGFIGIGTIASAVITGICSLPNAPN